MLRNVVIIASLAIFLCAAALAQDPVQITQGPRVEHVDSTTAVIAWSTNVNAGSTVRFGSDPDRFTQSAEVPWGGITHRVTLRGLNPNTTYYFQVISAQGQGTGTRAASSVSQFQTSGENASSANSSNSPR